MELPVYGPSNPPCLICHGKGSGIHYGLNTCEACKGFFGRCYTRKTPLKCKAKGNCEVENTAIRHCAACRFKKCLALGMSKKACQVGRNSSIQRTKVIEEVNRLRVQSKLRQDGTLVAVSEHKDRMDDLVKLLTDTKLDMLPNSAADLEDIIDKEKNYLKCSAEEEVIYGKRGLITRKEYNDFYSSTGMDVDGRRQLMKQLMPSAKKSLDDFVTFASKIPGFDKLPQKDKHKLLKYGIIEVQLFQHAHQHNLDDNIVVHPYDYTIVLHFDQIFIFSDDVNEIKDSLHKVIHSIQALDLTIEEYVMASALCLLISEVSLSAFSRNIVSSAADYVLEALQREVEKNHDPEEHTLAKIIVLIAESRTIMRSQLKALANFLEDFIDMELPENLVQLFGPEHSDL